MVLISWALSRPQGHSAKGIIMSMKNPNDRTRDLPACSAVPHPTTLPRAPHQSGTLYIYTYTS